jgi:hypothetical protein
MWERELARAVQVGAERERNVGDAATPSGALDGTSGKPGTSKRSRPVRWLVRLLPGRTPTPDQAG